MSARGAASTNPHYEGESDVIVDPRAESTRRLQRYSRTYELAKERLAESPSILVADLSAEIALKVGVPAKTVRDYLRTLSVDPLPVLDIPRSTLETCG